MLDDDNPVLVPNRECGDCNVCCAALTIDDPALQKPPGFRCRNTLLTKVAESTTAARAPAAYSSAAIAD